MALKIVVEAGHGGGGSTPGKRTPDGEYEWGFSDKVVKAFMNTMKNYQDVEVIRVDDYDASNGLTDVPLATRVNKANSWKADLYISFHQNAYQGKWGNHGGTETYYYEGSSQSKKLAEVVHKAVMTAFGLTNRGLKVGNGLFVVRKTNMPAVLSEGGFMDSNIDIKVLRDASKLALAGQLVAKGIADWKGLKKKASALNNTHTIIKGDTLWGLSKKYNTTVKTLQELNPGVNVYALKIGTKLNVPN